MNAGDQRQLMCLKACQAVEKVLGDLDFTEAVRACRRQRAKSAESSQHCAETEGQRKCSVQTVDGIALSASDEASTLDTEGGEAEVADGLEPLTSNAPMA